MEKYPHYLIIGPMLDDSRAGRALWNINGAPIKNRQSKSGTVFLQHAVLVTLSEEVIQASHHDQARGIEQGAVAVIPGAPVDLGAGPAGLYRGGQAPGGGHGLHRQPPLSPAEQA